MDLPSAFRELAAWAEGTSPLYERLCRGVADDPDALTLAGQVPPERSPPHVLLAAVHFLLLREADHQLREFYPSATDDVRPPADAYPAFHEFCVERADDLRPLLRERRTQTNAVRRCTALFPAFCHLAREAGEPLALVELGPSAGLNLLWDRYAYDYGTGLTHGATDSPVVLDSDLRGGTPPTPESVPTVASRVGVDLHPLDVTDADDADWLRALVWPEHADRRELLDRALSVAREYPPRLVEGDAVDDLPALVRDAPADATVCAFNTSVLYQLPDERRAALRETLAALGEEREVYWLSGEGADEKEHAMALELTRFPGGETETLGRYEQHGRWVDWR